MKQFLGILIFCILVFGDAVAQSSISLRPPSRVSDTTIILPLDTIGGLVTPLESRINLDSLGEIKWSDLTISPDPCGSSFGTYWPMVVYDPCLENRFHCRICGKPFKVNESMVYVLMKIEGDHKYFDVAHLRCSLKRIK